jgi:hypothetical protein
MIVSEVIVGSSIVVGFYLMLLLGKYNKKRTNKKVNP